MGGMSSEREVSLASGRGCAAALREEGFEVVEVDCGRDLPVRLDELRPDVAFNALHGPFGEDGTVQGILEWMAIPYTHSGVLASALALDKERTKAIYRNVGLPVVESVLAPRDEVRTRHVLPPPYVVKPYNEGSSVGVYIVHEGSNGPPALPDTMPEVVMVEAFAAGRELTTTVLGDRALTVTDILTDTWYDYDAKYRPGGSRHVVPADIPADIFDACLSHALTAHRALGCRSLSRTDFRWDPARGADGLILLETNTQPGMTPTSLTPEQAQSVGISFGALCRRLVEEASCNR
ncbi:D-alanine--D-alanine ligase [Roseivivax isoporae LMG 25204]|uniref:D-alanine--D-alanine ligase n=2 Tax=Roseivivax TaxID=93682 RepID=X7F809_9RHOB|nr:D-alanine--D-alanine ligase [Roseivivax isoporae LMG 25204]